MFLSDNETKTDLLYYESIASTVVELVTTDTEKPISIGIHGDWGAGKSSVLAMIENVFKDNKEFLCLRFNGWTFQGFEDAKTALLEGIVEAMKEAQPTSEVVKQKATKLFQRIDWFKVAKKTGGLLLTLGTGLPLGAVAEGLADKLRETMGGTVEGEVNAATIKSFLETHGGLLKDEEVGNTARQIQKFREEFGEFIKTLGIKRLVVQIDDLDRCLPETAIQTLEAAKLFLFLPQVAFIVAADEGMIEYSVKRHFPDLPIGPAGASYARAYLEKLIQVPFRIPALGDGEIHAYIALLMAEATLGSENGQFNNLLLVAREKLRRPWEGERLEYESLKKKFPSLPDEVRDGIMLSDQIANILARGTQGNPRQVKRFINSLMLRQTIANARGMKGMINRPVLAKLMLAERFQPEFYTELAKAANESRSGKIKHLGRLEEPTDAEDGKKQKKDDEWTRWEGDEWTKQWALLQPKLIDEDLRPYVFVTRDKKALFGAQGSGPLDELADLLMGPRIQVTAQRQKIKSISQEDATAVFGKLRSRIMAEDSYADQTNGDGPAGFPGMLVLIGEHKGLEPDFLRFLSDAPVSKLGAWAVKHVTRFSGDAARQWSELTERWMSQNENKVFAKSVEAVMTPTRK